MASSSVTCRGVLPFADTSYSAEYGVDVNRIVPTELQAPPLPTGESQRVCSLLPSVSIRFNFPPAKNPMERPSGDQKEWPPPSVPGSNLPSPASLRLRSQRASFPWPSTTEDTSCLPSGEMAGAPPASLIASGNWSPVGGRIAARTTAADGAVFLK